MPLINLKLKRETCKFSPNNGTHAVNSHACWFPSTRFYTAGWGLAESIPDAAKIRREEMDHDLADPVPALRKQDHTFLSVQETWSWEAKIMAEEENISSGLRLSSK